MTGTADADLPAAFAALAEAGLSPSEIAEAVQVREATVRRWATGKQQPRNANYSRLLAWVGTQLAHEVAGPALTVRSLHLQEALGALPNPPYTPEPGEQERLAEQFADYQRRRAEALRRDAEDRERERRAELERLRDRLRVSQRPPYESITRHVDPFELCQPEPELVF